MPCDARFYIIFDHSRFALVCNVLRYTWYKKKYFYKEEICNYIFGQHFRREKGVLQERQIRVSRLSIPLR